jgi:hypothetical protein
LRATLRELEQLEIERKTVPCHDCGNQFKPHQMQFDHLDANKKLFNISEYRVLFPAKNILIAEMDKCDVVAPTATRTERIDALKRGAPGARRLKPFVGSTAYLNPCPAFVGD